MNSVTHQITHGPSFSMLRCELSSRDKVVAQAGSMVARSSGVKMEVKLNAGHSGGFWAFVTALLVAVIRKVIGGETFFVNHFTTSQQGSVWLAPSLSGDIVHRKLAGGKITLSAGAFLASSGDIDIQMKWGGLRALLAKEGLFFLEISGTGDLWFNSYGGIQPIDVNGSYVVDNGHLVGFEGSLTYDIKSVSGNVLGLLASGEGLVCEFRGQGRVYIQSRNLDALVSWITPYMP